MLDATFPDLRATHATLTADTLRAEWQVQHEVVRSRHGTALALIPNSYDDRLAAALADRVGAAATDAGLAVAGFFDGEFDPDLMAGWIGEGSRVAAEAINGRTRGLIGGLPLDEIGPVFDHMADVQAVLYGEDLAFGAVTFGGHEAAQASADAKTWRVNSFNPRAEHSALSGETVGVSETFSNGMRFPRDASAGDVAQVANCKCSLVYR